jgi:multicomponent Na+:H+ antiporter subunit D
MAGSAALLFGIVWLEGMTGPIEFANEPTLDELSRLSLTAIFALCIGGLAVKAAMVPFHGWLPQAMAAPAPVSALLHAVAVVKAGAFGIVRFIYDVYGIERVAELSLGLPLAIVASITIIYGSLRALQQTDIKRRLAFSTVSQVSYIALGASLAGPFATIGGLVHLVHQGLMKITLFFAAGALAERRGITSIDQMVGAGRHMPLTMLAFSIGALGMIGIPPIAGFVSKWYLGVGGIQAAIGWVLLVLAGSSLLNAAYFLPLIYRAWFVAGGDARRRGGGEGPPDLILPAVVTALRLARGRPVRRLRLEPARLGDPDRGGAIHAMSQEALLILAPVVALPLRWLCWRPAARGRACWISCRWRRCRAWWRRSWRRGTALEAPDLLFGLRLEMTGEGALFLGFASALWIAAGLFARAT